MKCKKCNKELLGESKFCSNCGEKVVLSDLYEMVKTVQSTWFFLGTLNGVSPKTAKDLVQNMKEAYPELYSDYQQEVKSTKEIIDPLIEYMDNDKKKRTKSSSDKKIKKI